MIRARFLTDANDPRPVNWPIKHPYWISGYIDPNSEDGRAIVVAYADDLDELLGNWPDAEEVEADEVEGYTFTERFSRPSWFEAVSP